MRPFWLRPVEECLGLSADVIGEVEPWEMLRGVTEYTVFADTAQYFGPAGFEIGHAHNININTDIGHAYIVGSDSFEGGLHVVDITDPANPTFAGGFAEHGYTHDTQCVQYEGAPGLSCSPSLSF